MKSRLYEIIKHVFEFENCLHIFLFHFIFDFKKFTFFYLQWIQPAKFPAQLSGPKTTSQSPEQLIVRFLSDAPHSGSVELYSWKENSLLVTF